MEDVVKIFIYRSPVGNMLAANHIFREIDFLAEDEEFKKFDDYVKYHVDETLAGYHQSGCTDVMLIDKSELPELVKVIVSKL